MHVEPCYWGGTCGSQLYLGGASIPEADTTRAVDSEENGSGYHLALWGLLFDDPFAELDLLALSGSGEEPPPGAEPPGTDLYRLLRRLTTQPEGLAAQEKMELGVLFAASGVSDYFEAARDEVAANYRGVIQAAAEPLAEYRFAIARALVARSIQLDRDTNDTPEGWLAATGLDCDRMVELLMAALGGEERGIADRVKERAGRLVTGIATRRFRRRRGRYSDQFAPFGADVIVYQTRPRPIRDYIRGIVYKASATAKARGESGAVTVVAHSLGGVATFDALLEKPDPAVRRLITVGSQVPLLYELDALSSMPLRRDRSGAVMATPHQLPDNFPKWLNVYDPRDFLSYRAEPVFGGASVQDIEVDNSLPFPEAHSGYWRNHNVWSTIFERLKGDGDG